MPGRQKSMAVPTAPKMRKKQQPVSQPFSVIAHMCMHNLERGGGGEGKKKRLEWNGLEDGMGRKYRDAELSKRPNYLRGRRHRELLALRPQLSKELQPWLFCGPRSIFPLENEGRLDRTKGTEEK